MSLGIRRNGTECGNGHPVYTGSVNCDCWDTFWVYHVQVLLTVYLLL